MSRHMKFFCASLALAVLSMGTRAAWSEDDDAVETQPADAQAAQIDPLIEKIQEDDETVRREATDQLLKIGMPAVEPLAKAAESDDAEVVQRCFDVMGRLLVSEDEKTAKAAQQALEKLSKSEVGVVGRKARITLGLKEVLRQREGLLKDVPKGGFAPGGIRINQQLGGFNQSTKVSIVNGKRHIEVTSGDEKVEIDDMNGKDIVVKQTRTVDGKKKTDQYKAANLDDLKKKHPDGAKLYEKYTANNAMGGGPGGLQFQIRAIGGPGGPGLPGAPFQFPAPGFQPESLPNATPVPRTIKAEQDGSKIEVTETDGKKICVKLTKVVDGKDVSQEFKADDLKSLKAEHPQAAEIYTQLTGRKAE